MEKTLSVAEIKRIKSCIIKSKDGKVLQTSLYNKNGDPVVIMKYDGSYDMLEYTSYNELVRVLEYGENSKLLSISEFEMPSHTQIIKIQKFLNTGNTEKTIRETTEDGKVSEEYYLLNNKTNLFEKVDKLPSVIATENNICFEKDLIQKSFRLGDGNERIIKCWD